MSASNPAGDNQTTSAYTESQAPAAPTGEPGAKAGIKPGAPRPAAAVQVPGYRITEVLGRGGMGVVYKAIQEKANRAVALKMILAGAHADQADQVRFRAEAEAAARLSHPHIVQLYEVGETPEGFPFFSLEFVAGGTLAERLKRGPLRPVEAAHLIETLARAMQYAHERGVVHRDLKPANILLTGGMDQDSAFRTDASASRTQNADPTVIASAQSTTSHALGAKISDFGLAKQLDSQDGVTRTGAIMGTPSYMAPEQAFGQSKNVGPAADIYALGAMLYECLTGRPPFRGATVADTLEQVRTMEPVTIRAFVKEIPADLETICLHCLHKEPLRRYASADALAEDLRRYCEGQPISVRPVGRLERTWRWCRRNPWLAGTTALAALLLIAVAGVSVFAYFDAEARNTQIEKKRQEAEAAQKVARARLEQSLKALGLFATDFRGFCEDALVPGASKAKMYEALIEQLESQTAEEGDEATEDALRNKSWLYQTMAIVYLDTQKYDKAGSIIDKGLEATKAWLDLKSGDDYALSFYAAFLSLKGDTTFNEKERTEYYDKTLELRRKLAHNKAVDQFTPGRSLMQLADTLDKLALYDESLKLRQEVCELQVSKGVEKDKLHESFDFWAWTCWKAYLKEPDEAKKRGLLEKCDELSCRALEFRPGSRRTLERLTGVLRELGDSAYNHAKKAEAEKRPDEAKKHGDAAQKYFERLFDMARRLAVAPDLLFNVSAYARSFYAVGVMQKSLGRHEEARESFSKSRQIREQLLRDFGKSEFADMLRIDLLFSLVALGEHKEAVRAADVMRKERAFMPPSLGAPGALYRLACIYSLSVEAVAESRAPAPLTDADRALQAEYRDKALAALELSHRMGNADFAGTRLDADFIPIRGDARFQAILALEKKGK
ncbi:MAG: serine/threonine-protein kinase [Gemmataceae bacterium]